MQILITAGPTREPIDAVRYLGNRSSGKMGAALASAALRAGHTVTLIVGPVTEQMPVGVRRINVETAREMSDAVVEEFPGHDALLMAAAVADYRPRAIHKQKIPRVGTLTLELESTEDIVAAASRSKRPNQRTIGFSLEDRGRMVRREKLVQKNLDMIVYNPTDTMSSDTIEATLIYPDGHTEELSCRPKGDFADILLKRTAELFPAVKC